MDIQKISLLRAEISKLKSLMYMSLMLNKHDVARAYKSLILKKEEELSEAKASIANIRYKIFSKSVIYK